MCSIPFMSFNCLSGPLRTRSHQPVRGMSIRRQHYRKDRSTEAAYLNDAAKHSPSLLIFPPCERISRILAHSQ
ncbi:unnamed protein product [Zymoseptoria tritici ST99CH_3D7]|uniref:Uncharacterized protein n=1 Tax=Zymoseptoria tritici (strain ST99CH_3D7) TaxID=1276538 RepID=A0A1X7RLI5_ZYMT9|nr:unnamed protein product [Zymoseptoria tritici ST99CH_3D7]